MSFFPSQNGGAIAAAVHWVEGAMLGSVATAAATISIASIGYLAFTGRVDIRRAAQGILGCFILFGAPSIAAGLQGIASAISAETAAPTASGLAETAVDLPIEKAPPPQRPAYDPYAGAAIAPQ